MEEATPAAETTIETGAAARCRVVRSAESHLGKQGLTYRRGLSGETAGSKSICMTALILPDGARAKTHFHEGVKTAVYIIEGHFEIYFGARLEDRVDFAAGDYVYIPAGVAHLVLNRSGSAATALVAQTAADDQEGIVLLPELDRLVS